MSNVRDYNVGKSDAEDIRAYNVGASDYAQHKIQPWDIYLEYNLNPWDADIVKRVLRTKKTDTRIMDYEKIIHTCKERIRQLEAERSEHSSNEPDYKTVVCPSEADRPKLQYREGAEFDGIYRVYSVFQSDGRPYAYLGYEGTTHVYLDLGQSSKWACYEYDWMPKNSFGLYENPLDGVYHAVSMEIGTYGLAYGRHDYIITHGNLYRYMDATPRGHVYRRFDEDGEFTKVITEHKIFNEAIQHVKGNNK